MQHLASDQAHYGRVTSIQKIYGTMWTGSSDNAVILWDTEVSISLYIDILFSQTDRITSPLQSTLSIRILYRGYSKLMPQRSGQLRLMAQLAFG